MRVRVPDIITMRVQTEEWRRFIPGVRMYKGKKTYFYNGEILRDMDTIENLIYNEEERESWEVIIVLPGVEVIPQYTFQFCSNLRTVIMADTVTRVEQEAFDYCVRLSYVRLSRNLEYIAPAAFGYCVNISSLFIPPSCREIDWGALIGCEKLIILSVSHQTQLYRNVIAHTALIEASPFTTGKHGDYEYYDEVYNSDEVRMDSKSAPR